MRSGESRGATMTAGAAATCARTPSSRRSAIHAGAIVVGARGNERSRSGRWRSRSDSSPSPSRCCSCRRARLPLPRSCLSSEPRSRHRWPPCRREARASRHRAGRPLQRNQRRRPARLRHRLRHRSSRLRECRRVVPRLPNRRNHVARRHQPSCPASRRRPHVARRPLSRRAHQLRLHRPLHRLPR